MIQATAKAHVEGAPLKGRLVTLEAEVAGLEGRINALQAELGTVSGASSEEPAVLLETAQIKKHVALYGDYAKALRLREDLASLTTTTEELESKMATIHSDIQTLRNQVSGNAFGAPSLISTEATKLEYQLEGSSLRSRVVALEHEV